MQVDESNASNTSLLFSKLVMPEIINTNAKNTVADLKGESAMLQLLIDYFTAED